MRFIWLALSITLPLFTIEYLSGETRDQVILIYQIVCLIAEVVFIGFTISEFVKNQKREEYIVHQKIKKDRDEDISWWRKEFMKDVLSLQEVQKGLEKAQRNSDS